VDLDVSLRTDSLFFDGQFDCSRSVGSILRDIDVIGLLQLAQTCKVNVPSSSFPQFISSKLVGYR
jgi:hypothetical protein